VAEARASTGTERFAQTSHQQMTLSVLHITPAERSALQMMADGLAHGEIADHLRISECVLDAELTTLFSRMGVAGRNEAVAEAVQRGLVTAR
jgi:DNA-binding NarL/FixJ family response regulator